MDGGRSRGKCACLVSGSPEHPSSNTAYTHCADHAVPVSTLPAPSALSGDDGITAVYSHQDDDYAGGSDADAKLEGEGDDEVQGEGDG